MTQSTGKCTYANSLPFMAAFALSVLFSTSSYGQWAVTFDEASEDTSEKIKQASPTTYMVIDFAKPLGSDKYDAWLLTLDTDGNIIWQKTYGDIGDDIANFIQETTDSGYIVAGKTDSFGAGMGDGWVFKLDYKGEIEWQKTYGGVLQDTISTIWQTDDEGYIMAGRTHSFGVGKYDAWVLKLDHKGEIEWQRTYGGHDEDFAYSIQQTGEGGYIMAGTTRSFGAGGYDIWAVKLDRGGNIQWQKTYGGKSWESIGPSGLQQLSKNGGYIIGGKTHSFGAGGYDAWILKLDPGGNIQWQKTYGGKDEDSAARIEQTKDKGYIVAGDTKSFNADSRDAWIFKLDYTGKIQWQKIYGEMGDDMINSIRQTDDGGYFTNGFTTSFGAKNLNNLAMKLDAKGMIGPACYFIKDHKSMVSKSNAEARATNAYIVKSNIVSQNSTVIPQDTNISSNLLYSVD